MRRHDRWIASKYKYYIRKSGPCSFDGYFDLDSDRGVLKKAEASFGEYIDRVERMFGRGPFVLFHEELVARNAVTRLSAERQTVATIFRQGVNEGMRTLKQDGIDKVLQGYTDILQVRAVCIK